MRHEDPEIAKRERVAGMFKELRSIATKWLSKDFTAQVKIAWEAGHISMPSAVKGGITQRNNNALKEYKKLKKTNKKAKRPEDIEYPKFEEKVLRSKKDFKRYFGDKNQNLNWRIMEPFKLRLEDDGTTSAFLIRMYVP
jgi:hypothetical protein